MRFRRLSMLGGLFQWLGTGPGVLCGRWGGVLMVFGFGWSVGAQEPFYPLKAPDRSTPQATLKTFLDSADAAGVYIARNYRQAPSRQSYRELARLLEPATGCLDLSEVAPAARPKTARMAVFALYETLNRIQLPALEDVPGTNFVRDTGGTNELWWVIPNTEIVLERVGNGHRQGQFLFSAETVSRALEFYERVRALDYSRPVPLANVEELVTVGGGWMIPYAWLEVLPGWLRGGLWGQALWKWVALALLAVVFLILLRFAYRISSLGSDKRPVLQAVAHAILPGFVLAATPVWAYIALMQVNVGGAVATTIELASSAILFLSGAWIVWRGGSVVAEAIIASPKIAPQSVDAHLVRICTRLLGIVAAVCLLVVGAERLGLPLYGVIAGLGVGGLTIALAAQPTVENLIGGLSLFADKPVRVGDFCKYGEEVGTVENIGIRSTRIRGLDRTVTTIPNAALSKMPVVNFTLRDRMLLKSVIGLRYETKPEQLRFVLAKLRELLLAHPKVTAEPSRVRFIGFGVSSVNLEVFAYVATGDWNEFLEIQEDIYLRMMDVVESSGTGFAFPSQTVYFARDGGLDAERAAASVAEVEKWRAEQRLPFPNFDLEFRRAHRDTLDYPPKGSATGAPEKEGEGGSKGRA